MSRSRGSEEKGASGERARTTRPDKPDFRVESSSFVQVTLPQVRVQSTRVTPFLADVTEEIIRVVGGKQPLKVEGLLFVTQVPGNRVPEFAPTVKTARRNREGDTGAILSMAPITAMLLAIRLAAGAQSKNEAEPTEAQRDLLRHFVAALLEAGPGWSAVVPFGMGAVSLHLFEKTATASDYLHVVEREWKPIGGQAVPSSEIVGEFNQRVAIKLSELPLDFAARREALRELHGAVRTAFASSFEAVLNAHAATLPQQTYEDKKTLAKWVNAELRELGLTIRCPRTGQPALLRGHPGGVAGVGRFHLEITDSAGVQRRTVTSVTLPELQLQPDDLTRAPYGERGSRSR